MANKLTTVIGAAACLAVFAWMLDADAAVAKTKKAASAESAPAKSAPVVEDVSEIDRLVQMSNLLDDMDRQEEFDAAVAQADGCIKSWRFDCAEAQLGRAAKSAKGADDANAIAASRQSLANERQRAATEAQRRAEAERVARIEREQREAEERERREQEAEERAQRQQAQEARRAQVWAQAAQIIGQAIGNSVQTYNAARQMRVEAETPKPPPAPAPKSDSNSHKFVPNPLPVVDKLVSCKKNCDQSQQSCTWNCGNNSACQLKCKDLSYTCNDACGRDMVPHPDSTAAPDVCENCINTCRQNNHSCRNTCRLNRQNEDCYTDCTRAWLSQCMIGCNKIEFPDNPAIAHAGFGCEAVIADVPPRSTNENSTVQGNNSPNNPIAGGSNYGGGSNSGGVNGDGNTTIASGNPTGGGSSGAIYEPGGVLNNCIQTFNDPKFYNWISFRNVCSEAIYVQFFNRSELKVKSRSGSGKHLNPGQSDSTGYSSSDAPQGFWMGVCHEGFFPVDAQGKVWEGASGYKCKKEGTY